MNVFWAFVPKYENFETCQYCIDDKIKRTNSKKFKWQMLILEIYEIWRVLYSQYRIVMPVFQSWFWSCLRYTSERTKTFNILRLIIIIIYFLPPTPGPYPLGSYPLEGRWDQTGSDIIPFHWKEHGGRQEVTSYPCPRWTELQTRVKTLPSHNFVCGR